MKPKPLHLPSTADNPLFSAWTSPFETPPFDRIKNEHFKPAITEGIKRHNEEIKAIAENPDPTPPLPTKTIVFGSGNI